jgi:CDP-glucose 4,6-dehydratase
VRDYFYVRDAANAYLSLAERLPGQGVTGEAFNFGNEEPQSVLQVVNRLLDLMNRSDLRPIVLCEAQQEIREQYLDCAKARRILEWQPEYPLDEGLRETIRWYERWLDESENRADSAVMMQKV